MESKWQNVQSFHIPINHSITVVSSNKLISNFIQEIPRAIVLNPEHTVKTVEAISSSIPLFFLPFLSTMKPHALALALSVALLSNSVLSQTVIKSLPGFPGELPFYLETGYTEHSRRLQILLRLFLSLFFFFF